MERNASVSSGRVSSGEEGEIGNSTSTNTRPGRLLVPPVKAISMKEVHKLLEEFEEYK